MSMPINVIMRINNIAYKQSIPTELKVGDLVFDTKDNSYGYVDMIHDEKRVAVRDGHVTELGVSIERLRLLTPINS